MINWPVSQPTLLIDSLEGRTAFLRPLREDDIEAIFQACQDPTISAFTRVPFPYDREMAEEFVRGCDLSYRNHQGIVFAIEVSDSTSDSPSGLVEGRAGSSRFAGTIGLHGIQLSDHFAEVGYWVEKSHRSVGLCTAALQTLLQFSFEVMAFRRIEGMADFNNIASQRTMERAGMVRDALLQNRVTKPNGDQIDMVLFSKCAQ
jgi:RimJ/RimL family protein N-acetyltransferase